MNFNINPPAAIENAIIDRLQQGLGRMVQEVGSYAGELDDDMGKIIRRFPAAWVTFGGIKDTKPISTSKLKFKPTGLFMVMVCVRSVRSEAASRTGGPAPNEQGSYLLLRAVRRLLSQQDLGLPISHLQPGKVTTLFNTALAGDAVSAFSCEFTTSWIEEALQNSTWPIHDPTDPDNPDAPFAEFGGRTDPPAPDLLQIGLHYHLDPAEMRGQPDATDIIDKE